jgi:hypothetical protein
MATGSYPWIPPIKGSETQDCFVYRTIEDLNAIESCARRSKRGAVVGGGLLGLEAAGALKNLGVETHVIEFAPMLMAEQLDQMGGEQLRRKIESMGVKVHTSKNTKEIVQEGTEARKTMRLPTAASCRSILSSSHRYSSARQAGDPVRSGRRAARRYRDQRHLPDLRPGYLRHRRMRQLEQPRLRSGRAGL